MAAYLLVLLFSGKLLPVQARYFLKWGLQLKCLNFSHRMHARKGGLQVIIANRSPLFFKIFLAAFYEKFSD